MRPWVVFAAAVVGGFGVVYAVARMVPAGSPLVAVLLGLLVVGSGLGGRLTAVQARKADRTDAPDGVEQELATRAAAATVGVAYALVAGFGLWLLVERLYTAAAVCYLVLVVLVVAYRVAYGWLRRQAR